jgi:hypothetical protein
MREIILDASLTVEEKEFNKFDSKYFFKDNQGFEPVRSIDAPITHQNYLSYLCLCWKRHYGIIISPTVLWNMVLNNLAFRVNKTPDVFRKYFSESEEKIEICVEQGGNLIDTKLLIAGLQGRIPSKMLEDSFPEFSTDTEKSRIANYTAFLDMVSPYYNYSMYLCGIPKVRVLGTQEDWLKIMFNLGAITSAIPEFTEYLLAVANRVAMICENTCDYGDMFRLDRCGSGSQAEVAGWITEFYIEQPQVSYLENFIPCISKIDYHNYNDGKDYRLFAGLFTSIIEDSYLVPEFDNMYFLKKNPTEAITKKAIDDKITLNLKTTHIKGEIRVTEHDFSKIPKQENETFRIIDGNKILIGRKGK